MGSAVGSGGSPSLSGAAARREAHSIYGRLAGTLGWRWGNTRMQAAAAVPAAAWRNAGIHVQRNVRLLQGQHHAALPSWLQPCSSAVALGSGRRSLAGTGDAGQRRSAGCHWTASSQCTARLLGTLLTGPPTPQAQQAWLPLQSRAYAVLHSALLPRRSASAVSTTSTPRPRRSCSCCACARSTWACSSRCGAGVVYKGTGVQIVCSSCGGA